MIRDTPRSGLRRVFHIVPAAIVGFCVSVSSAHSDSRAHAVDESLLKTIERLERRIESLERQLESRPQADANLDTTRRNLRGTSQPPGHTEIRHDGSLAARILRLGEAALGRGEREKAAFHFQTVARRFPQTRHAWAAQRRLSQLITMNGLRSARRPEGDWSRSTGSRIRQTDVLDEAAARIATLDETASLARARSSAGRDQVARESNSRMARDVVGENYGNDNGGSYGSDMPRTASRSDFKSQIGDRVFFESGSSRLDERSQSLLEGQVGWILQNPSALVRIEGHADEPGSRRQNFELAASRAEAVRAYFLAHGVPAVRITVASFGRKRRVALCESSACAKQNRRVVTVVEMGDNAQEPPSWSRRHSRGLRLPRGS